MGLIEYGGARPDITKKTLHNNGANLTPSSSLQILLNYLPGIVGALIFVFRGFWEKIRKRRRKSKLPQMFYCDFYQRKTK